MTRSLVSLLLAGLYAVSPALAQNPPPQNGVAANDRFVYVVRGDQLLQYDAKTLRLLRTVGLPPVRPRVAEAEPEEELVEEEEPEEPEEIEEIEEIEEPRLSDEEKRKRKRAVNRAIGRGLDWLARHQSADGRWDTDGIEIDRGIGAELSDVGVTGLALLAFVKNGNTMRGGPYQAAVKKGAGWLREQQHEASGLIGVNSAHDFIYNHAIATYALAEIYGISNWKALEQTAQRAINYLESHRNPYAAWRYQPRDNDNDTSITAWCVSAYCAGQRSGLEVNANALKLAQAWFDSMTDPVTGRTGYTERGGMSSRKVGDHARAFPREKGEAMTAAALMCRTLIGQKPAERLLQRSANLVLGKPPVWDPKNGSVDLYYWYFGSQAMRGMGGSYERTWRRHAETALLTHQRDDDGRTAGSWDPVGAWGRSGGRIYSTALGVLALQ